jgi:hypothetical protein
MTTRLRPRFLTLLSVMAILASAPTPAAAQGTATDSTHAKQAKDTLTAIRKRTTSSTVKRWVDWLTARENALLVAPAPPAPPPAPTPVPFSIAIHGTGSELPVGGTMQLLAEVHDASGAVINNSPVTWSTTTPAIADLSGVGLLTGKSAGSDTVMARAGTVFTVRVTNVTGVAPAPSPTPTPTPNPTPVDTTLVTTGIAERPRVTYREDAMPPCTTIVRLLPGTDLQAALNSATPGTCLLLAPGATFTGNFTLPNKGASTSWISIRTDVTDAALGAIGTRMTPARAAAANLARIRSLSNQSAFVTAPGAHHYRLTGLDVGGDPSAFEISGLIRLGAWDASEPSVAAMAKNLVLDRMYIHGTPTQTVRRCVFLSGGATQVTDSWIDECHSNNGDSQTLLGLGGAGPYTIDNNELSGGAEVILFGGGDPVVPNLVASDISITRNHITRSLASRGVWSVKNCLELKSATRVLIQANVIEHNWADAQTGFCVLFKSVNQDGGCPLCGTTDVTMVDNLVKNSGSGFNIAGDVQGPSLITSRITLVHNLVDSLNVGVFTAEGSPLQLLEKATDVSISHLTFTQMPTGGLNAISLDGAPLVRLSITASAFMHNQYGIKGGGTNEGSQSLAAFAPGYTFKNNVLVAATCAWYPATTICPATWPATMPLAPDSLAIGADRARVAAATLGVVVPSGLPAGRPRITAVNTGWRPTSPAQRIINTRK